jgi:ornithine carbamoyltransferase
MITTAKALGNGFPCAALLMSREGRRDVKLDLLGTTFGGGPMACAASSKRSSRRSSPRTCSSACAVVAPTSARPASWAPVTAHQGAGFLTGLRTTRPAKEIQAELLDAASWPAPAAIPTSCGCCRRSFWRKSTSTCCGTPCRICPHEALPRPRRLLARRVVALLELARARGAARAAGARRQDPRPAVLQPSLRTLASFQAGMARLGGSSFVITPGQGTWQLETRLGVVMNGAAAEHVREGIPVLASYCDAWASARSPTARTWRSDLAETTFSAMASLVDKPLINLESAINHPCQALADWKTMDDLGAAERAVRAELGVASARAAARGTGGGLHMAAMRGMEVVVLRPEGFALPPEIMAKAQRAAAASGGSVRETAIARRRSKAHRSSMRRNGDRTAHYGDADADARLRAA